MPERGRTEYDYIFGCWMQPKYRPIPERDHVSPLLAQGSPTQPTARSPTPPSTQQPTQSPAQAPTQSSAQFSTQSPTQPLTQPPTQAPIQPSTQAPTQAPAQAPAQAASQPSTQQLAQSPTQPASDGDVVRLTDENSAVTQLQRGSIPSTSRKKKKGPTVIIHPQKSTGGTFDDRGISVVRPTYKNSTLTIRPPLWTGSMFRIRAENYEDAQYIADAVHYYIGRGPFYFCDVNFQYPPLCVGTRILSTREMCRAYVESISSKDVCEHDPVYEITREGQIHRIEDQKSGDQKLRAEYIELVKAVVLEAVTSPEAVLFLRSLHAVFVVRPTFKNPTVVIRPPKWTDSTFRIRAATYEEAQYIADAVLYYVGREPICFRDANFQYLPLHIDTCTLFTREMFRDYVENISQIMGPAMQRRRQNYMEHVKDVVLNAVKSPEVVQILRSLRFVSLSTTNFEAAEDCRIAVNANDAASIAGKCPFASNEDDDPTVYVSDLACTAGVGSDWFDWGIIPLAEHKTSSSMKGFVITLEGFLSTLDGDVQSVCMEEVNSGISENTGSGQEYQQNDCDASQDSGQQCEPLNVFECEVNAVKINQRDMEMGNDQQRELLSFPEGEADAVTITKRDMESLQPKMYLSDNIIDFYFKYLERRLSTEEKKRTYLFSSFFFTKLLGINNASIDIDLGDVDYEQVRKWTMNVNLFEKDYVLIPILRSSHWSLIIISHLSSLMSSPDKKKALPCIFHLDSVEGKHKCVERQVRSYLYQECMERYQASNKKDQMLLAVASQINYVQAKVPQQENGFDCGLYILHYVETFLFKSPCFLLASSKWGAHFAREVSAKRLAVQELIIELSRMWQEQGAKSMDIPDLNLQLRTFVKGKAISGGCIEHVQNYATTMFDQDAVSKHPVHLSAGEGAFESKQQPKGSVRKRPGLPTSSATSPPRKYSAFKACAVPLEQNNSRNWTNQETLELLTAMVGGRFCRGKRGGMRWDDVNIEDAEGRRRSKKQCQNRYDVLVKAYKTIKDHIDKTGKPFSEISEKERRDMKLATSLTEEWYKDLDKIYCQRQPGNPKSQKRAKLNPGVGNNPHS